MFFLKDLKKPNISNGAPSVIHELKLVLFYVLVLLSSCSCLAACTYQVHLHTTQDIRTANIKNKTEKLTKLTAIAK